VTERPDKTPEGSSHGEPEAKLARGFGAALLGRLGAVIEAASIAIFAWLYGAAGFGLFAVLWGYLKVLTAITEWAQPIVLQRLVPGAPPDQQTHSVSTALMLGVGLAAVVAAIIWWTATALATGVQASDRDSAHLVAIIRLYVWTLPLWTFVEIGTAAIRARGTFGPEIKVRIFYEQALRLAFGTGFASAGYLSTGLFLAHLISIGLAALLTLRLIVSAYGWAGLTAMTAAGLRHQAGLGLMLVPVNTVRKLFSELPVMLLNLMLPGASGAAAAGLYAVARKLASVLQVIRLAFDYVMAPLSSAGTRAGDLDDVLAMARFSTRLAAALGLPLGAALAVAAPDILQLLSPEFQAAYSATLVLLAGRAFETLTGPSAAIVEALGKPYLPALNGFAGLMSAWALSYLLIPKIGLAGAAIGTAVGLNITAGLFLWHSYEMGIRHLSFDLARIIGIAVISGSGLMAASIHLQTLAVPGTAAVIAIAGLGGMLWLQINYGLRASDAAALGHLGRLRRKA